ncbi:MAG: EamA family transporter [Paludibacteraceae bacterium]|nr:EamA family transporter [Paludibacteraceae bacterium]
MQNKLSTLHLFSLIGINMLYACVGVCTKLASQQPTFSWMYILFFGAAIAVMGLYAVLWQQILKRIQLSTAYMFKGTALIFTMLVAALLFGEPITTANIIGSAIIIAGIVLLARSDD